MQYVDARSVLSGGQDVLEVDNNGSRSMQPRTVVGTFAGHNARIASLTEPESLE